MNFILEFDEWQDAKDSGELYEFRTKGSRNLTDAERKEKSRQMRRSGIGAAIGGLYGAPGIGAKKGAKKWAFGGGIAGGALGMAGGALAGHAIGKGNLMHTVVGGMAGGALGTSIGAGVGGAYGAHRTFMKQHKAKLNAAHPMLHTESLDESELYEFRTKGSHNLTDAERKQRANMMKRGAIGGGVGGAIGGGLGSGIGGRIAVKGAGRYAFGGGMAGGLVGMAGGALAGHAIGKGNLLHTVVGGAAGASLGTSIGAGVGGAYGGHRVFMKQHKAKLNAAHPMLHTESLDESELYLLENFQTEIDNQYTDYYNFLVNENAYSAEEIEEIQELLEAEKSEAQKKYAAFFKNKLQDYNVKHPDELKDDEKKKFFNEIKKDWQKVSSIPECLYMTDEEFVTLSENLTDDDVEYLLNVEEDERVSIITNFLYQ